MSATASDYEVIIVGYGPVGVTAANLLGGMGLRVAVVERDASVYPRARAISTDEEVIRIWQGIGLAERLKDDMLAGQPIDFVDTRGRSFLSLAPTPCHGPCRTSRRRRLRHHGAAWRRLATSAVRPSAGHRRRTAGPPLTTRH